ncbi:hypothetical protein EDC04DRAFT_2673295 [Pisolithus marmoratus]|nr:hypothetical protein EDC04DRAFT_2673295 [Pisolithus marmoratus]
MPATEKQSIAERMSDNDKDTDPDREKSGKSKSSSSKQKDLSHVPCKFFKVGACTAGSSCPFSHTVPEPGQSKDVCTWFVKGNCKFGHKCALAHVLPGQTMAMDRKNKKAAQLAANGGVNAGPGGGGKGSKKKDSQSGQSAGSGSGRGTPVHGRPGLLSGSTAPTRATSSRPPISMSLKATISPSAPAPPLKDTDFAAFVLQDDDDTTTDNGPTSASDAVAVAESTKGQADNEDELEPSSADPSVSSDSPTKARNPSPPTLPVSVPNAPRRPILSAEAGGLGPIGSPPRGSLLAHSPLSRDPVPSTFHAQTSLLTETRNRLGSGQGGIASSLGSTQPPAWKTELGPVPSQVLTANTTVGFKITRADKDRDREGTSSEEDLEEFLPSSLTDLLSPSERSRRMSRTHSNSSRPTNLGDMSSSHHPQSNSQTQSHQPHHRYSRSVPAPSLLGDVKSIWADHAAANNGLPGSPDTHAFGVGVIGSGTPSSLKSANGFGAPGSNLGGPGAIAASPFGATHFSDDPHLPSPSLLAPSNASAAFLPGLHHYYSKMNATNTRVSSNANGLGIGGGLSGLSGLSRSPLSNAPLHTPTIDEGRAGTGTGAGLGESPSIRALQAHAPGQSLPQGLAAGYSRIHALPVTGSPGSIGTSIGGVALSPGQGQVPFGINAGSNTGLGVGQDWLSNHSHIPTETFSHLSLSSRQETTTTPSPGPVPLPTMAGLDAMFSRLPTANSPRRTSPQSATNSDRHWHKHGTFSPLGQPVATADDDDLFNME